MIIPRYNFRIAAHYNQPLGSLVNIETIVPTGDKAFYPPVSYGEYDPGVMKIRGNGRLYLSGYAATAWVWTGNPGGRFTPAQDQYLSDTYCGGGRDGTITAYTPLDEKGVYRRVNAVMTLPKLPEAGRNFSNLQSYVVRLTRIQTLD